MSFPSAHGRNIRLAIARDNRLADPKCPHPAGENDNRTGVKEWSEEGDMNLFPTDSLKRRRNDCYKTDRISSGRLKR